MPTSHQSEPCTSKQTTHNEQVVTAASYLVPLPQSNQTQSPSKKMKHSSQTQITQQENLVRAPRDPEDSARKDVGFNAREGEVARSKGSVLSRLVLSDSAVTLRSRHPHRHRHRCHTKLDIPPQASEPPSEVFE